MKEQETLPATERVTRFGRFELRRASRALSLDGKAVPVSERAMDVLLALVDARGRIVPVSDLQQGSSPSSQPVANSSVQALVSQLRRALGDDRDLIETVPRRGYRLTTEWVEIRDELDDAPAASVDATPAAQHRPVQVATRIASHADPLAHLPLVGRDAEFSELTMRIAQERLVTLMGARGIGKTRLAREAAPRVAALFEERVYWIDLGMATLPAHLAEEIAAQAGVAQPDMGIDALVASLGERPALFVIDHGGESAQDLASVIEAMLAHTRANVMVCAQAPLFVPGEYLLPLAPLRFADLSDATKLFTMQLHAAGATADDTHPAIASICRAVSGNPLALQLAAQQIAGASAGDALAHWDREFCAMLSRRSGLHVASLPAEHAVRTVIATRFDALGESARRALRCLSLCARPLSWADAQCIAACDEATVREGLDAGLVTVSAADDDGIVRLTLHAAVREYTLAQLVLQPDTAYADASLRHAQWLARGGSFSHDSHALLADLRRGLNTSIDAGRIELAVKLLQASRDLWSETRREAERIEWIGRTLAHPDAHATLKVRDHMLLTLMLAEALGRMHPKRPAAEAVAAWWRVYDLATACADDEMRLRGLSALLLRTLQAGYGDDHPDLLGPVRERIVQECEGSSTHPGYKLMRGVLLTLDGCHEEAMDELAGSDNQLDGHPVAAVSHNALAISLWLTGARPHSDPALLRALTDARQQPDPVSRCAAAALACILFLLEENDARIGQQARLLCSLSREHGLAAWEPVGRSFLLWTEASEGNEAARQLVDRALANLERRYATLVDLLSLERFADAARREVGAAALSRLMDQLVVSLESSGRRWLLPEALRVSAALRRSAGADEAEVVRLLHRAMDVARGQRATRLVRRIAEMASSRS
ncbi:winged helix-turn-helix domain-containing protein [Caballeronia sp. LZ035]|uniref:ATP-binding protein n=1 Tax=Caballeronia sp. LZ035 TaxID=3038568 RepID=UPI002865099B|nr:winged helix-turn-helix domain-containing protein [Caballeronia sp. LZ035]MDR5759438.1 winged helix-turn-helix domain-containing protein [Caballeronia sp. LZ035]